MLRPVALDLLVALLPPLLGGLAFLTGTRLRRLPLRLWHSLLILVVTSIMGLAVILCLGWLMPAIRDWSGAALHQVGGAPLIACPLGLLLLGVVWTQPGRSTTSAFLLLLAVLGLLILAVDSGSRLWWRWMAVPTWSNLPDAQGCVRQSTWLTCGPAASAMLLNHQGIRVSEGELAYRAGASLLLGTDLYIMADVLTDYLKPHGKFAAVVRIDYQEGIDLGEPLVAQVDLPGGGGHAVYVERLTSEQAEVIDPRDGRRSRMSRHEFEGIWEGRVILLRTSQ